MRYTFPASYDTASCYLVPINATLIPLVAGALKHFEERRSWHSDEEHEKAYNAFAALEAQMTQCTMQALLDSNDRLYRLLDSGLNGTVYTASGDPVVISPTIGDVPPELAVLPGMVARLDHLELMLDALPGTINPGWFGIGGAKATLADVVNALRIGNSDAGESFASQLEGIMGAGGDTATIGELVVTALNGSVSAVEEGGIFLVLSAGVVGMIAGLGAVVTQLTSMQLQNARIIHALDGGAIGGTSDSILEALRGTTAATGTRNVIDSIVAALALVATEDPDVLAKLEEIRALLA